MSDVLYSRIVIVNGHGKGWNRNGSSWFGILHDFSFSFFFFGGFVLFVCVYFFLVGFVGWVCGLGLGCLAMLCYALLGELTSSREEDQKIF